MSIDDGYAVLSILITINRINKSTKREPSRKDQTVCDHLT